MYKIFLPNTTFNIYSDNSLKWLTFWSKEDLENQRKSMRTKAEKFIIHDGPPYANGNLHMGHAENKIAKDVLNRIAFAQGYDTPYILGWDAHGLPIENAVEKELKAEGVEKKTLSRSEFWDRCFEFAQKWMSVQKEAFKKLGIMGRYDEAYATFYENESIGIIKCIHDFVLKNLVERRLRPVLWSIAEQTALAYAEVEYKDKKSNSIFVAFPISSSNKDFLKDVSLIVWTTTPWTLPANEAIAYHEDFSYIIFEAKSKEAPKSTEKEFAKEDGDQKYKDQDEEQSQKSLKKYVIAKNLLSEIKDSFSEIKLIHEFSGKELANTYYHHVLPGFAGNKPMIFAKYVKEDKGSGFVHTAPAHGEDDFLSGKEYGLNIEDILYGNGYFKESIPLVGGKSLKEAEALIIATLGECSALIKHTEFVHSYPHSWRSKAPLIFRLTNQWFLKMSEIKDIALKAANDTALNWVPAEGKRRFLSMLEGRDDWCISRQRIWGVPIAIFFHKDTGKIISDVDFLEKTRAKLTQIGVKNWWSVKIEDIDSRYSSQDYIRLDDIVDIWFESGATQSFVLKERGLFPADVYLEGSDQHRGWFQSSLIISAVQNSIAPWRNLITHGFCLDSQKQKMSKSLGNVVDPLAWNTDELRVFFCSLNLAKDISLTEQSINHAKEILFRFKNTIKFLLGVINTPNILEKTENEPYVKYEKNIPDLEKWVLHRIYELDQSYDKIMQSFEISQFVNELYEFCAQDLSAFYFDIRKDSLYCQARDDHTRNASIYCIEQILPILIKWIAPFAIFTAEDAWEVYSEQKQIEFRSVHLQNRPIIPKHFKNDEAYENITKIRAIRKSINEAIEKLREDNILKTSYEASLIIPQKDYSSTLREICIVSSLEGGDCEEILVSKHSGMKCPRCKFFYDSLKTDVCNRCFVVLDQFNT
jgi:isoleucyl-tRNA synthetase